MMCSSCLLISLALYLSCLIYDARCRRTRLAAVFESLWAGVDRRKLTTPVENERRVRVVSVNPVL